MSELSDFYQQQALPYRSNVPWLQSLQDNALADFNRMGFPTRHCEDWKYTTVDSFLKQRFETPKEIVGSETKISPDLPTSLLSEAIIIHNGHVEIPIELTDRLPEGVVILPMSQAVVQHADHIDGYLGRILQQNNGFQALNTAMLRCGVYIYVPAGVCLTTPLVLSHRQDNVDQAIYLRHVVIAEEASSLTMIEHYQGDADTVYFTSSITEAHLAAHAKLVHYKIQCESKRSYHVGHLAVKQRAGSQFDSHSFSTGGQWVRSDIDIALTEPDAQCSMNGLYAPLDGQHVDHHTVVTHEAPKCRSEQDYKGILSGRSRAVFNGRVIVAKDAQHTVAMQQNKNVLLSKNAEIDTKPQLEIFADDVVCTHGATVGQLDEDALFYLATRGIGRAEAMRYLVQAFAVENLRKFANDELAEWLGTLLNQQVG